ncbi:3-oxoacyl-ACP reductase FabG [Natranaerobius thermophilus]|uniref:3-oxoacyl-(Acyl-carrier-protein) reductase n=1 Tax=Natranaerobius thermophilus (strain ATCC BAA-1301 / DSM 18059 / JW/NM-WN-LF) TaxID=457570 RepID=B2A1V7_NATTJ|nr:3-oxoacyl-ACP reductase FabG [Natranaerobius thermophilus]ACB86154.1 3-oxoacyl-(acyl-carrier-protein) reductase [Natranaerobius thermophilus JW/NM-WN-LF]
MRLKDKVAIITGGGSGIGRETALLFAREGAKVVVADINKQEGEEVVNKIENELQNEALNEGQKELQEQKALFVEVNVKDKSSVEKMTKEVINTFGQIDILVNNAGITKDALLRDISESDWQQVIDVNLTGVFNCTQVISQYMTEKGYGKIINASSVVGIYGNIGQTNYAATKSGVIGMTKSWAKEFGKKGVRVNAVAPGFIKTPMTEKVPEKILSSMENKTPLKQLGEPLDVAYAYLFLASSESDYISGTVIEVGGGLTL